MSNEDFFPSERMLKSTEAMCVARRRPRPQAMHEDFLDLQYVITSTSRRDESSITIRPELDPTFQNTKASPKKMTFPLRFQSIMSAPILGDSCSATQSKKSILHRLSLQSSISTNTVHAHTLSVSPHVLPGKAQKQGNEGSKPKSHTNLPRTHGRWSLVVLSHLQNTRVLH